MDLMRRWLDFVLLFALIGMVFIYALTVAQYEAAMLEARQIIQALEIMLNQVPVQPNAFRGA